MMKLKQGLRASYVIQPENVLGLFYSGGRGLHREGFVICMRRFSAQTCRLSNLLDICRSFCCSSLINGSASVVMFTTGTFCIVLALVANCHTPPENIFAKKINYTIFTFFCHTRNSPVLFSFK